MKHLCPRILWILAGMTLCGACGTALAQGNLPLMRSGDRSHSTAARQTLPVPSAGALPADSYLASHRLADDSSLATELAKLKAWQQKVIAEQAAAKKQAAGHPTVKAGGRIDVDWAAFDQNAQSLVQAGDCLNGTEFRRARIGLSGEAFDVLDYKIEVDFAGQTTLKDVYMTINELPLLGHVRLGHFKEPWSLEQATTTKCTPFMERGLNHVFSPERNTGVMVFNYPESENMTWAIGFFATLMEENPPVFPYDDYDDAGGTSLTMRHTFLPWYDEATEGRGLLHTGICYTHRDIPELVPGGVDRFRLATRPEAHLAEYVANTGWLDDADTVDAVDGELALVYGPFSVQSEYTCYWLRRTAHDDPMFHGGYIYASWFLTGEHRPYERTAGCFERVKPFENFFRVRAEDGKIYMGKGAWELAYRVSYVNLSDAGVRGGEVIDHTFGINWYLNPYMRLMFNYVHSETDDTQLGPGTGTVNVCETRAQISF
jgi:phosphate-selective porin OprO/OprP